MTHLPLDAYVNLVLYVHHGATGHVDDIWRNPAMSVQIHQGYHTVDHLASV